MPVAVIMPQMGESITEGTITRWLVEVGETVERDQPLVEISTDKVDAELPSPAAGTLLQIHIVEGQTVEVDTPLALIGDSADAAEMEPAPTVAAKSRQPEAQVVSSVPSVSPAVGVSATVEAPALQERIRKFSSPVVRRIAEQEGVDLERLEGSGVHGRVTKSDILQYLEHREHQEPGQATGDPLSASAPPAVPQPPDASFPSPPAAKGPAPPIAADPAPVPEVRGELVRSTEAPVSQVLPVTASRPTSSEGLEFSVPAFSKGERVELEPMSRIRRLTAAHMLYSQQTSAHVTTVFEADFSRVVAARDRVKEGFLRKTGTKLTFMPFVFRAVLDGLRTYPKFNASISGTDIVYKQDVNLGMAVALDWGLIVPVIKSADQLNLVGLATHANDLAERARSKQLKPEEVQGGTFTVTNPGVFGSLFGTPIINQPQVAILCVGAIEKRPVVITDEEGNDGLGIRWMSYLALSYDHRLIDGADAELFMVRVKQTLSDSSWDELSAYSE